MVEVEPEYAKSQEVTTRRSVELITFTENRKPQNNGICKLKIYVISKALKIQPEAEEYNDILAVYDWKFIRSKNILFVFAHFDFQDFVLVFKNEDLCIKVFDGIFKKRNIDFVEIGLLKERFLNPLFKNASRNSRLKEILEEWIQLFDGQEKNEHLKLLKWHLENPEINFDENEDVKPKTNPLPEKNRKRRHHEIETNSLSKLTEVFDQNNVIGHDGCDLDKSHEFPPKQMKCLGRFTKVVDKLKFEIVTFKIGKAFCRRLLLFTSSYKTHYYDFKLYRNKHYFYHHCREDLKGIKAILTVDENGKECIKIEDKEHQCFPLFYEPQKCIESKIAKNPNDEILKYGKRQKTVPAKICENDEIEECVILSNAKQICSPQNLIYQPKKYKLEEYEVKILKPTTDYILFRENGKYGMKINLLIYHTDNKNLCYKYSYIKKDNIFQCSECANKKSWVTAKLHEDAAGNEFLTTDQKEHICTPIKYSSIIKDDTVILEKDSFDFKKSKTKEEEIDENRVVVRSPNFKLHENSKGVPERRLIVFSEDDRELCYNFKYHQQSARFWCKNCNISAKIQIDEENDIEKFVILSEKKHKCEPLKYEPEKSIIESNEIENRTSNFMVFNRDDERKPTKLIIFTSSSKNLCYEYSYCKIFKTFQCCGCNSLKKIVRAKLLSDDDGIEYVHLLKNRHVCSPKKFILEEFQPKIVPENGFKLCSSRFGKTNAKLILFDCEKDGFGYEYSLSQNNYFTCHPCNRKNVKVAAKLFVKENGQKYLKLSSKKHVCESKKYEPEKTKVTKNFVVHYNVSGIRNSRLTVFNNDDDKSFGYQYYLHRNLFRCYGCAMKSKYSHIQLITDKNGIQSLEFNENEHVCAIQNLKNKKFYFADFIFKENGKTLITNDPIQNNRFYKFKYDEKLKTFRCVKCIEKKKYITATICKENDGKEFVLLNSTHCCNYFTK